MKYISILPSGYGHWKISMEYRNKEISCVTNNSTAIDDYRCDEFEKDGRELRKKRGFEQLKSELVRKNYENS